MFFQGKKNETVRVQSWMAWSVSSVLLISFFLFNIRQLKIGLPWLSSSCCGTGVVVGGDSGVSSGTGVFVAMASSSSASSLLAVSSSGISSGTWRRWWWIAWTLQLARNESSYACETPYQSGVIWGQRVKFTRRAMLVFSKSAWSNVYEHCTLYQVIDKVSRQSFYLDPKNFEFWPPIFLLHSPKLSDGPF